MKIAYFGFDLFKDCLIRLEQEGHEIIKIFTNQVDNEYETNKFMFEFARNKNIPITDSKVTRADIEQLEQTDCDLIFSAAYYYLIPVSTKIRGINVHPAFLPVGQGSWPSPVTILKGLNESGVTIHKLAKKFDEGDILIQKSFEVTNNDNLETVTKKFTSLAPDLAAEVVKDFERFWADAKIQENGEYWTAVSEDDMTFTLDDEFEIIDKKVRAFYGYGSILKLGNEKIIIKKGECIRNKSDLIEMDNKINKIYEIKKGFLIVFE